MDVFIYKILRDNSNLICDLITWKICELVIMYDWRSIVQIAKEFGSNNNYNMNVLCDKDSTVAMNYNIESIPGTLFIDNNGYIVGDHMGEIPKSNWIKKLNLY